MTIFLAARAIVFAFVLFLPTQEPGPPQPGPHDLAYCTNHDGNPDEPNVAPHACMCQQRCDQSEDRTCLTYCKTPNCKCIHEGCTES